MSVAGIDDLEMYDSPETVMPSMPARSIGSLVRPVTKSLRCKRGIPSGMTHAMSIWHEMRDERVRQHVIALSLRPTRTSRELIAFVDASVWMYEFNMLAPALLQEWNSLCMSHKVDMTARRIVFKLSTQARQQGFSASLRTFGKERELPPVPLTTQEALMVSRTVSAITDEGLRTKVQNAMTNVLEWKKSKQRHIEP